MNQPKNKEIDDVQGFMTERWHRQVLCVNKRIHQNWMDTLIQGFEEYTKEKNELRKSQQYLEK